MLSDEGAIYFFLPTRGILEDCLSLRVEIDYHGSVVPPHVEEFLKIRGRECGECCQEVLLVGVDASK